MYPLGVEFALLLLSFERAIKCVIVMVFQIMLEMQKNLNVVHIDCSCGECLKSFFKR